MRKHDLGLCHVHGCRKPGIIAVYPNDHWFFIRHLSEEENGKMAEKAGFFFVERWHMWSKTQHNWFMLSCQEHWDNGSAKIVASGENLFTYEPFEQKLMLPQPGPMSDVHNQPDIP